MAAPAVPPHGDQQLNDFVAECILALEQNGEAALEAMLAARPEVADRARSRLAGLRASGLIGAPEPDPERIGPYRIRQRIGSGGMGTVYLAQQDGDLERRVAVKVIKRGMDTREVLARFALERQALAMLDHQNIAKVLDAGQTGDGRPFLVMEYVAGLPITRYCDERRLSLAARIELFCLVCEAVQHAHHKGLIHRDLKPSNILVADREGRPWPIVIDFGVAKSLGTALSAQSVVTMRGRVLGTPEYMSPEQAANDMDVDTRADVWSLGVVLYELLTGTLPIDSTTLRRADSGELPRILRGFDTPAPSRRVTRLGGTETASATARQTDPAQLRRRLRGDLDWITLRALERDRNRRYGMPGELAADLQRHLRNEPVLAGPPSALYRWRKFFARNRLQVLSAAVVVVSLVAGLWASVSAYRVADASARQAESDFDAALAAIERLVFFGDQRLVEEPQMDEVRRHLLQDALAFYERLAAGRSEEPRLVLRTALAAARAARIQFLLGDYRTALATVERAKRTLARLPAASIVRDAAFLEVLHGETLMALGRSADAETAMRAASAALSAIAAAATDDAKVARMRLEVHGQIARLVAERDQAQALASYEVAMQVAERWLSGADPDPAGLDVTLRIAVHHAMLLAKTGDAETARDRAEDLRARILAASRGRDEPARQGLVPSAQELAGLHTTLAMHEGAQELLAFAAAQQRWLCAAHPAQVAGPRRLGIVLYTLADVQLLLGYPDLARASIEEAIGAVERLVQRTDSASDRALLGKLRINEARILAYPRGLGGEVDVPAIEASLRTGVDLLEALPAELRQQRDVRVPLVVAWSLRADNEKAIGRPAEALAAVEHTVAEMEALVAAEPTMMDLRRTLVDRRAELADLALAAGDGARALALADAVAADGPAIEAAVPMVTPGSYALRVGRIRMRAHAALGDVDATLAEVRRPTAVSADWSSARHQADALLLLVERLGPQHARRGELLGEARDRLQRALGYGESMDASMAAMVAVMSAQTLELLVRVERAAGDLAAAAAAAERALSGYEPSFRDRASPRNTERTFRAGDTWLRLLAERGDRTALASGVERLAALFDRQPRELLRLAEWCGTLAGGAGDDPTVRAAAIARAVALLRRCRDLGALDLAAVERSMPLAIVRGAPEFAALLAERR